MHAILIVLLAAVTLAKPGLKVTPPEGWTTDGKLSTAVLVEFDKNARLPGLGEDKILTGGGSWVAPEGGGVLHVLWMVSNGPPSDVGRATRDALDGVAARFLAGRGKAGSPEVVSWKEEVGATMAEGHFEGRNPAYETRTFARLLVFVDGKGNWHEARVECVVPDGPEAEQADGAARKTCLAALASATITVPETDRKPLGDVPPPGSGGGNGVLDAFGGADAGPDAPGQLTTPRPGQSLGPAGDGGRLMNQPPVRPDAPAAQDRQFSRMLLIGGGILIILALAVTMGRKRKPE